MTAVEPVLFYSPVSGQITCEKHAPSRLSDTWRTDRWEVWTSEHDREWAVNPTTVSAALRRLMDREVRQATTGEAA